MAWLRQWGPRAYSADHGGQPAGLPEAPTTPNFLWWAVLGRLVWSTLVLVYLEWIWVGSWATLGLIDPESTL